MKEMRMFICLIFLIITISCRGEQIKEETMIKSESVFNIKGNKEYTYKVDQSKLLRNPCCGWGLYDDASGEVANADIYWQRQDEAAKQYASYFYVRWRWAEMEPEEGKYAWIYNENYKKLIKGALDRGLKLAFRIYYNSKDNLKQSTPDFVREAGAKGTFLVDNHNYWNPYIDDPIFQQKLENFIKAFAKEYDDPDKVDFVDGVNMGSWGENHGLNIQNPSQENKDAVLKWITGVYGNNFKKVILVMNLNTQFTHQSELNIAVQQHGYCFRRDGLGSMWYTDAEKEMTQNLFPKTLLLGESCYWQGDDTDSLWFDDATYHFKTWRQIYEQTYQDAIQNHFNTLDLRTPVESKRWMTKAKDLVEKFIANGGYRLYPKTISLPETITLNTPFQIGHEWENVGSGFCPNNNIRWNFKYRVAFALMDKRNSIVKTIVDNKSNPSAFIKGKTTKYLQTAILSDLSEGNYKVGIAIVDTTKGNVPAILLATKQEFVNGWFLIGSVTVK